MENLEMRLEYYAAMLRDDVYFDAWGGPLLDDEDNAVRRSVVLSRASGYIVFVKGKEGLVRTPCELKREVEIASSNLRQAMEYAWKYPDEVERKKGCVCQWKSEAYQQFMSTDHAPDVVERLTPFAEEGTWKTQRFHAYLAIAEINILANVHPQQEVVADVKCLTKELISYFTNQDRSISHDNWPLVHQCLQKAAELLNHSSPMLDLNLSAIYKHAGDLDTTEMIGKFADTFQIESQVRRPKMDLSDSPVSSVESLRDAVSAATKANSRLIQTISKGLPRKGLSVAQVERMDLLLAKFAEATDTFNHGILSILKFDLRNSHNRSYADSMQAVDGSTASDESVESTSTFEGSDDSGVKIEMPQSPVQGSDITWHE